MLEINLLGTFEAKLEGNPIQGIQLRHADELLALLTLERGRRVQRLWIEDTLDLSNDALRKTEGTLRACLGDQKSRLVVHANGVYLDTRSVRVDVFEFESLIARGDVDSLEMAIRLYRGGLLKDWKAGWLGEQREELRDSYLDALKTLARTAMEAQDFDKAASYLRRFTTVYPEMDSAWAQLIKVYRAAGYGNEAEAAFKSYLTTLKVRSDKENKTFVSSDYVREALESQRLGAGFPAAAINPAVPRIGEWGHFELAGGAVPLDSAYYVVRDSDASASSALSPKTKFILIKGSRQVGKTSLLARLLHLGREHNARVIRMDWQTIPQSDLESAGTFLLNIAESMADQLQLEGSIRDQFPANRAPLTNFNRFMLKQVLPAVDGWLVWGIDEADRLFDCSFRDDVLGMLRSWQNGWAADPQSEWAKLTVIISYATEVHLIQSLKQSPFNVGYPVELSDFTFDQVEELNRLYGEPLRDSSEVRRLYALVGGHPYLVRRSLQEMVTRKWDITQVETQTQSYGGFFHDHLERLRLSLLKDERLTETVSEWLLHGAFPGPDHLWRLCAAGVAMTTNTEQPKVRCALYDQYLRKTLP